MLIVGICTLLAFSAIIVRIDGTTDRGGRFFADSTSADPRGTLPQDFEEQAGINVPAGILLTTPPSALGLFHSPLAIASLTARGVDFLAGLRRLLDELNSGAITGLTFDFVCQGASLSN